MTLVRPFGVALLAALALASVASTTVAAPLSLTPAPSQQVLFPGVTRAHLAYYSWQAYFAGSRYSELERFTWPDASMVTVGSADGASLGANGTYLIGVDPWAGVVMRRTLSEQIDARWVVAADNREWTLRYPDEYYGKRGRLIARDVTGRIRSVRISPRGALRPQAIVPTRNGLRIVMASKERLELADTRWRVRASYRFARPMKRDYELFAPTAAPLSDGSVVVSMAGDSLLHPSRIVRLRPGRKGTLLWDGPLVRSFARAADGLVGVNDRGGIVAVDDRGRLRRRTWEQLGLPASVAECSRYRRSSQGSVVATNGRALIAVSCRGADWPYRGVTLEVDGKARVRGIYDLAPAGAVDRPEGNGQRLVGAATPMADGSVPYLTTIGGPEESASGWSTWLPTGSVAPRRGRVTVAAAASGTARVSVVCNAPYGQLCSGIAEVRDGDTLVGTQRYSLPGRPGKAAAREQFIVALSANPSGRLRVTAVPLPPRPLLNPPRPSWDGSIPW